MSERTSARRQGQLRADEWNQICQVRCRFIGADAEIVR